MELKNIIGKAISDIVDTTGADCVLLVSKEDFPSADTVRVKTTLMKKRNGNVKKEGYDFLTTKMPADSIAQIRRVVVEMINKAGLEEGDKVFCVTDETFGTGFEGLFLMFTIDEKFTELSTKDLDKEVNKAIYDILVDIANEIASEGREGKKIGTAFIFGDHENVLEKSSQMILNPLEGHPLNKRNIMEPDIRETIKELSQLDGVFIIDEKGYVHAAGRYLSVDSSNIFLPGFGARHTSCAAMTKETKALAIVVSESGGRVRVFKEGKIIHDEKV